MTMKTARLATAAALLAALAGAAQAALIDRGGGMIYDTTRNLTWLADMNYARTSGYSSDGRMGWDTASAWAGSLVYGGFDDWRLPTIDPADTTCSILPGVGYNCTGGELSGLFVTDLGFNNDGSAATATSADNTAEQIANLALFKNLQLDYWSGVVVDTNGGKFKGGYFSAYSGIQAYANSRFDPLFAVAVRDGDVVAPATLPEPQTLALALLALGATQLLRRPRAAGRRDGRRAALRKTAAATALLALAGAAQAALIDRGGGMIYDTTRNLTWLADMNHALTSGYAAANAGGTGSTRIRADNGSMGWDAAVAWAGNLVYGGFDDWRLPTLGLSDPSCDTLFSAGQTGGRCSGGELSGLFAIDLGLKPGESVFTQTGDTAEQIANLALFSNVQADGLGYWSGTPDVNDATLAWHFKSLGGLQLQMQKAVTLYAVAVREGDVVTTASTVPEPPALALALLALGAAGLCRGKAAR